MQRKTRIYVGCEGDSERAYVRWLQSRLDEVGLNVHLDTFIGGGGDPLAVVKNCVDECLRRQKLYSRYKIRAVLLDSDKLGVKPSRDQQIRRHLRRGQVDAIFQVFDHEALLLRHFDGHQTKRPARGRSLPALKKVWPTYRKPADAKELNSKLDLEALKRVFQVEPEVRVFLQALGFKSP